jgi:hypothetical protein
MSHEGERVTDVPIQEEPDRAPPHWLNPLVGPHGQLLPTHNALPNRMTHTKSGKRNKSEAPPRAATAAMTTQLAKKTHKMLQIPTATGFDGDGSFQSRILKIRIIGNVA